MKTLFSQITFLRTHSPSDGGTGPIAHSPSDGGTGPIAHSPSDGGTGPI